MSYLARRSVLALWLSLFVSAGPLVAQSDRGTITGMATDQSGAAMAGVSVTATNTATGVSSKTLSGRAGDFTIPLLRVGTYLVSAEMTGFKLSQQSGVVVQVGETVHVDIHMQLGNVKQTVEVTGQPLQVEKDTSERGTVVNA